MRVKQDFDHRYFIDHEKIVMWSRPHLAMLIPRLLPILILGIPLRALSGPFLTTSLGIGRAVGLTALVITLIIVITMAKWVTHIHTLTDHRLFEIKGIFLRRINVIPLDKLNGLARRKPLLSRFLNYEHILCDVTLSVEAFRYAHLDLYDELVRQVARAQDVPVDKASYLLALRRSPQSISRRRARLNFILIVSIGSAFVALLGAYGVYLWIPRPGLSSSQVELGAGLISASLITLSLFVIESMREWGAGKDVEKRSLELSLIMQRDLRNLILTHRDLSGFQLPARTFDSSDFRKAVLIETNLAGSSLKKVDMGTAVLTRALLVGSSLEGSDLVRAKCDEANLSEANLQGADLRACILRKASLRRAILKSADLAYADLTGADLCGADLEDAILSNADLRFADLSDANLSKAVLVGAQLKGARFSRSNLYGADFRGTDLSNADFAKAVMVGASLKEAELRRVDMSTTELDGADLTAIKLVAPHLGSVIFSRLRPRFFNYTSLRDSNLSHAKLDDARLNGAFLAHVNLRNAIFTNAIFDSNTAWPRNHNPDSRTASYCQ